VLARVAAAHRNSNDMLEQIALLQVWSLLLSHGCRSLCLAVRLRVSVCVSLCLGGMGV
jgi:hypothetical protein